MPSSKIFLVAFQPIATEAGTRDADKATLEHAILASEGIKVRDGEYLALATDLPDIEAASAHYRNIPGASGEGTIAGHRGDRLIVEEVTQRGSIAVHADDPQRVLAWLNGHLAPGS